MLLNGKPLKLRGVNRHDLYPQLGPTLPLSRYVADLDLLQLSLAGGSSTCSPCAPGYYYQNATGQSSCRQCPPRTFAAFKGAARSWRLWTRRRVVPRLKRRRRTMAEMAECQE